MTSTESAEASDRSMAAVMTPQLRRMLVGVGFSSIGAGLTMSLLVVYLHQVRGIPLQTAGLVLTWQAALGLVLAAGVGLLVDRIGPRPVLITACLVEASGVLLFGFVHTVPQAFGAGALVAIGSAGIWPPQAALLARISRPEHRQRVFGLQFLLLNLGIGVGGLLGASLLDVARPSTFTLLYAINAASYLIYVAAVASLRGVNGPEAPEPKETDGPGGYREVLADRRMRRYVIGALVLLTCGYGSMEAGIPAFITEVAHLPVNVIGIVFFFNTLVIVIGQVWVLKRIEGRSRSRVLGFSSIAWACCWGLLAISAGLSPLAAGVVITIGVAVFAVGEMLFQPVGTSLINDLAPAHLRGRYNAAGGLVWGLAGSIGPAFAGLVIGAGWGVGWALALAAGSIGAGMILRSLAGLLTPAEDGRTQAAPEVSAGVGG